MTAGRDVMCRVSRRVVVMVKERIFKIRPLYHQNAAVMQPRNLTSGRQSVVSVVVVITVSPHKLLDPRQAIISPIGLIYP